MISVLSYWICAFISFLCPQKSLVCLHIWMIVWVYNWRLKIELAVFEGIVLLTSSEHCCCWIWYPSDSFSFTGKHYFLIAVDDFPFISVLISHWWLCIFVSKNDCGFDTFNLKMFSSILENCLWLLCSFPVFSVLFPSSPTSWKLD